MSEKAKDSFTDIAQSAFSVLYHAVMRRDESFVTPEVMRVARALCVANGGHPDVLVHNGVPEFAGHSNHWVMSERYISMAWTRYVGQATCAIANLEAHRQEEDDRLKQQEKSYDNETAKPAPCPPGTWDLKPGENWKHGDWDLKGADIPVGFSGMNDGGIKGEYRILDILDRLERGKKFRAEAGTETYIKMIEEDRNELLRRLIASKLVPPYTVPPRRSLQ